jgi:hypothetical protein
MILAFALGFANLNQLQPYVLGFALGLLFYPVIAFYREEFCKRRRGKVE